MQTRICSSGSKAGASTVLGIAALCFLHSANAVSANVLRAGAAALNIDPEHFPVHVSGMHPDRTSSALLDHLHSRALVLDVGGERLAIVVVDSCMLPRDLLDRAKMLASAKTGIRVDRMLISATHTHSAPAAMASLGTPEDKAYVQSLPDKIARSIELAASQLEPARIGWTVTADPERTGTRRGIRRPDRIGVNPWGERVDRAEDPSYDPADVTGPSGPSDPDLAIAALQTLSGRPIALIANYANHYFGTPELVNHAPLISADYFGLFSQFLEDLVNRGDRGSSAESQAPPPMLGSQHPTFVAIMSQGASGDQEARYPGSPFIPRSIETYSDAIAREVYAAYKIIEYHDWVPLAMAEAKITLAFRTPTAARLAWAHKVIADTRGKMPTNVGYGPEYGAAMPYAYAVQQIYLHEHPTAELKLQAIRIGELGLTAIPDEVYALTGLKIKAQSPLAPTINIELANGAEGYLPPPEQFVLGSYTTWPAHSAGLEIDAEPKILETVLTLLERVSGRPRRLIVDIWNPYEGAIRSSKPLAYWRLNDMSGPAAHDVSGNGNDAIYESGVVFYLPGPGSGRAVHFAGGRVVANVPASAEHYSVELWFWNGLPVTARGTTGWLTSNNGGEALGLGGTDAAPGRLLFVDDHGAKTVGKTPIAEKTWNYAALVRDGLKVSVYLNGNRVPELTADVPRASQGRDQRYVGGRADSTDGFAGRISEVALYGRALSSLEVSDHFRLSRESESPESARTTPSR